jgi:hypothetical protein
MALLSSQPGPFRPATPFALLVILVAVASSVSVRGQSTEQSVVVTGDDVNGAYGAPGAFSRSRFSPTTTAYVLPPWHFYFGEIYEGDIARHGFPDHLFNQEIEMGLPYRFGIATEGQFERFDGGGGMQTISIEGRYAFADWGKIPLNPTIFAEYKFGVGTIRHEEVMPPASAAMAEEEAGAPHVPSAYELRLMLADEFFGRVEWAFNAFFEKENTGDRGREFGFAQSALTPILLPREQLKVGAEMQYQNITIKDTRGDPTHSFIIGPTVAYRTSKNTRLDVSSLFGCTEDSPAVKIFVVFSWQLGPGENEIEAPVSTRNR